ncbi:secretion/conjugation apparatus DotM-related subunit [Xanthomonas euvesicatoria]
MNKNQHRTENADTLPWGAIAFVLLLVFIWWRFHTQISGLAMWLRYYEGHLLIFDPEGRSMLAAWLGKTSAEEATLGELYRSGQVVGYTLRWPALVIVTTIFALLIWKSPARTSRYAKTYDMKGLAQAEAALYPTIKPVLDLDLVNVPLNDPINGMRQDARAYSKRHGLILPPWTDHKAVPDSARVLDDGRFFLAGKAEVAFAKQLGKPWQGISELAVHERSLLAAFLAQMNHDPATALKIFNGLAEQWQAAYEKRDPSLLTVPLVETVLKAHGEGEALRKLVTQHHYVRCVLMRVLESGRANGTLPPNWFRWLKMADRVTWYCLNDLGIDTASVEAAGVRAHYQAERLAKVSIETPMIGPAIEGTIEYLNTYLADEEN